MEIKPTDSVQNIKEIVRIIQSRWSKLSRLERNSFCPYIYIHNISDLKFRQIKQELFDEGLLFKDGYDFLGASFRALGMMEQATFQNNIKLKFVNSISDLDFLLNQITAPKEIYQFYQSESFYSNQNCKHIIIQVEETLDIKNIV